MERNVEAILDQIAVEEGGYSNRSSDKGGPTNFGVTLTTMRKYVNPNATINDLKSLTKSQARMVFRRQYLDAVHVSELPDGVDLAMADFAVNSGPERAIKFLQEIVKVVPDGAYGAITTAAVKTWDPGTLAAAICDRRLAWLKTLKGAQGWDANPGWGPRVATIKALSMKLAAQPPENVIVQTKVVQQAVPVPTPSPGAEKTGTLKTGVSLATIGGVITPLGGIITGIQNPWVQGSALAVVVIGLGLLWRDRADIANYAKDILQ